MAAVVLMPLAVLYPAYELEWKKTAIAEFEDTAAGHRVIFQEIGAPFLFGPSKVRIILEDEAGRTVDEAEDRIFNDGKALDTGNISVTWTDAGADVTLYGEEQDPKIIKLQYQP